MPVRPDLLAVSDLMELERTTCSAKAKRSGRQCERPAVPGANVCWHHGGAAPQVQAAALRRILDTLVPQGIANLHRLMTDPNVADSLMLRATIDVLDRANITLAAEPVKQEVQHTVNVHLDKAIERVLAQRLPELGLPEHEAIEAEVIEPNS